MTLRLACLIVLAACTQPVKGTSLTKPNEKNALDASTSRGGAVDFTDVPRGDVNATSDNERDQDAGPSKGAVAVPMTDASASVPDVSTAEPDAGVDASPSSTPPGDGAPPFEIVGNWSGHVIDATNREYDACVRVTQADRVGTAGISVYTGASNCSCDLRYVGAAGDMYSFEETPVSGRGCLRGRLQLSAKPDGTVDYNWFSNAGSIPDAVGALKRVDEC
jgi:hypothetical protein